MTFQVQVYCLMNPPKYFLSISRKLFLPSDSEMRPERTIASKHNLGSKWHQKVLTRRRTSILGKNCLTYEHLLYPVNQHNVPLEFYVSAAKKKDSFTYSFFQFSVS